MTPVPRFAPQNDAAVTMKFRTKCDSFVAHWLPFEAIVTLLFGPSSLGPKWSERRDSFFVHPCKPHGKINVSCSALINSERGRLANLFETTPITVRTASFGGIGKVGPGSGRQALPRRADFSHQKATVRLGSVHDVSRSPRSNIPGPS